ncbi:MAG: TP0183 family DNA metabolism protein [Treponemataceae bacterium]
MRKKIFICYIYFSLLVQIFSQSTNQILEFYNAVLSENFDADLARPIQDLYFSYMSEQNIYEILDKRNEIYNEELSWRNNFVFFIKLSLVNSNWISTISVLPPSSSNAEITQKEISYDSYNKLLLDIKPTLQALFSQTDSVAKAQARQSFSIESFAGNWEGEDFIDRIVLLRPGRGFVFFKGGASMPVSINFSGNKLRIVQSVKSNASFFPDIPRSVSLATALTADPIEWVFSPLSENYLEGHKTTLKTVYQDGVAVSTEKTTIPVAWKKVN